MYPDGSKHAPLGYKQKWKGPELHQWNETGVIQENPSHENMY
jgi:hypothetical protein